MMTSHDKATALFAGLTSGIAIAAIIGALTFLSRDRQLVDLKIKVSVLSSELKNETDARKIMGNLAIGCFEAKDSKK